MKRSPAFQVWAGDFLADFLHWTDEEVGAHFRLLCWSWVNRRGIPRDHQRMERIAPAAVRCWPTIGRLWVAGPDDTWVNEDLEQRREESDAFREGQRRKSELAQRAKRKKAPPGVALEPPPDSPAGSPKGHPLKEGCGDGEGKGEEKGVQGETPGAKLIPFDTFWDTYAKKIDRPKCEAMWAKLTHEEQAAVIDHAARYVKVTQGDREKYRRHPVTYLNNRSWESEDLILSQTERSRPSDLGSHAHTIRTADPNRVIPNGLT